MITSVPLITFLLQSFGRIWGSCVGPVSLLRPGFFMPYIKHKKTFVANYFVLHTAFVIDFYCI